MQLAYNSKSINQNPNHKKLNKKTNQFSQKCFRFSNLLKISLRIIFRFNFDNLTKMINKLQLPSVLLVYFLHYKDNKTKQESHKMIVDKKKKKKKVLNNSALTIAKTLNNLELERGVYLYMYWYEGASH